MNGHHEKRRDMARSVLPKNRRPARQALARAKRANRRVITQDLHKITPTEFSADADCVEWDDRRDLRRYPDAEIHSTVRRRRGGDKLNPFIRWAIASTADVPIEDRLPQLRARLPGGLIGNHAMSHLEREPQLRPAQAHDWRYWRVSLESRQAERSIQTARDLELLRDLLQHVIVDGDLGTLNRVMKHCDHHTTHQGCVDSTCVKRCLAGLHDIDQFLCDVATTPTRSHPLAHTPECLPSRRFRIYLDQLRTAAAHTPRPD